MHTPPADATTRPGHLPQAIADSDVVFDCRVGPGTAKCVARRGPRVSWSKGCSFAGDEGAAMGVITGFVRGGRIEVAAPADWPDGMTVYIATADPRGDDDQPSSPEEIAATLAAMDRVEPFVMTAEEEAAWGAERADASNARSPGSTGGRHLARRAEKSADRLTTPRGRLASSKNLRPTVPVIGFAVDSLTPHGHATSPTTRPPSHLTQGVSMSRDHCFLRHLGVRSGPECRGRGCGRREDADGDGRRGR